MAHNGSAPVAVHSEIQAICIDPVRKTAVYCARGSIRSAPAVRAFRV